MLMRGFAKVDKEGKIPIPGNIRRAIGGLKPGQLVEIKVTGPQQKAWIVIQKRKATR